MSHYVVFLNKTISEQICVNAKITNRSIAMIHFQLIQFELFLKPTSIFIKIHLNIFIVNDSF